jgi:predicted transcriptional regulator
MANTNTTTKSRSANLDSPEAFAQLSTVQQANVVHGLSKEGMNQKEISDRVGVSVPQVSNLITIYELPSKLKRLIEEDKFSGTLVLQIIRENKGKTEDEISDMFMEVQGKHNSVSVVKTLMQKYSRNAVKKNEVTFEVLNAIIEGNMSYEQLKRFFGITKN